MRPSLVEQPVPAAHWGSIIDLRGHFRVLVLLAPLRLVTPAIPVRKDPSGQCEAPRIGEPLRCERARRHRGEPPRLAAVYRHGIELRTPVVAALAEEGDSLAVGAPGRARGPPPTRW